MSKKNATAKIESETKAETAADPELAAIAKAKALLAEAKAKLSPEARKKLAEAEKAEKAARANRMTRIVASVRVLRGLNGEGHKVDDLAKAADNVYVQSGGPSNEKEARFMLRQALTVVTAWGLIEEKDGVVSKK